ncbi:MAG TPA: isoamylase early set domain-containing protein [Longimicrobiales bacterium]|nr:isoamylase early set domain-containing protein [Longimicrobiales bacterium]
MLRKRKFAKENLVKVTFSLPADVARESVRVVGEFNDWEGIRLPRQKDGTWKTTVALTPGRQYEFRYLIDEERWMNDPAADRYARNPFGDDNSVIET